MAAKRSRQYRFFEMIPGLITWGTFVAAFVLSYYQPTYVAIFIILFDVYWFLKGVNVATHLMFSYRRMKIHDSFNWLERCKKLALIPDWIGELVIQIGVEQDRDKKETLQEEVARLQKIGSVTPSLNYQDIYHLIVMPWVNESMEVLSMSIDSYYKNNYPKDRMILVLASEERAGEQAQITAQELYRKYGDKFLKIIITCHKDGVEGEAKVKGANITYATKQAMKYIDEVGVPYDKVLVSAFDSDTVVQPHYFAQLTYLYLTTPDRGKASFQPVMFYNNNVWDSPAINRVAAVSSSFWQMIESSRPDRLRNFSSHSRSLQNLVEIDFWPVDVIPEDSQIFWRSFLYYKGKSKAVPMYIRMSMDGVLLDTYANSLKGQYKQYRRWAWGVSDVPYVLSGFIKDREIPIWKKLLYFFRLIEGHFYWATAPIIIALLGWLPLILGGDRFENQILASNLRLFTGGIMTISFTLLILSVVLYFIFLPRRPRHRSKYKKILMGLQWVLVPITSIFFSAVPAIDAHTRLLFGKYMEFWVTPKHRKQIPEIKNSQTP